MNEYLNWVDAVKNETRTIKRATCTVFRQNKNPLNKLDINHVLTGNNWIDELSPKKAMVTFSKSSKHLIIIPKTIVDEYIFYPLFEENSDGYGFKKDFQKYEHRGKSILIKYREDGDFLIVTLLSGQKKAAKKIDLLKLPQEYWEQIDIISDDPLIKFISVVKNKVEKLSDGNGIEIVDSIC
jgi:hypothetical protein